MNRITIAMLTLSALSAQAYDLDEPSALERYEAREREIESGYGYFRGTEVVVPIPPSSRGPSYYGPNIMGSQRISTPEVECLRYVTGGMNCFPK